MSLCVYLCLGVEGGERSLCVCVCVCVFYFVCIWLERLGGREGGVREKAGRLGNKRSVYEFGGWHQEGLHLGEGWELMGW